MKRALSVGLALVVGMCSGAVAGYFYRHFNPSASVEMEDYALASILNEVVYAHYLEKNDLKSLRDLIDINLNSHLSRVRLYQGGIDDKEFLGVKNPDT